MRRDQLLNWPVSFVLAVAWWLCFRPGFYSADSFGVLQEAASGHISTAFTAVWPLFLRVVTVGGWFPGVATLIGVVLLTYALHVWCRAVLPEFAARLTPIVMTATPLVGAIGITLWHDVPMTSGLLLLVAVATSTDWFSAKPTRSDWVHLVTASALTSFRPNGLPTLVCVAVLALGFSRVPRRTAGVGLSAAAIALAVSLGAALVTGNRSLVSGPYAQEWMRADLSCMLSQNVFWIEDPDRQRLSTLASLDAWANPAACTTLNRLALDAVHLRQSLEIVPGVWLDTLKGNPLTLLAVHAQRQAYLLPIPNARALRAPFIHSTIEFSDRGIAWEHPRLANFLRGYVRAWNAGRGLLAYAGVWLLVLIGVASFARRTLLRLGPTIAMCVCLMALVFVTAPIPDARYALFVLVTGQSALVGVLLEFLHA